MESPLPVSSLRLLVPPLRLMSAAMWQVTTRRLVKHYRILEDFVCVVTEALPDLLTHRQTSLLLLGLQAKMTLELFTTDLCSNPELVQTHLDRIQAISPTTSTELAIEESKANLVSLTRLLLRNPAERNSLAQGLFDHTFDATLQSLVCDFLSRLDQVLPVPDFKQAASWLDTAPCGVEECVQSVSATADLKTLLRSQACRQTHLEKTDDCLAGDLLLSLLSSPFTPQVTTIPSPTSHSQSDILSEWVEHARVETEGVEVVIEEAEGEVEEVIIQPEDSDSGREIEQTAVNGQDLGSANGGGTNSIPAVLSLIALNQTPIVFIPHQPTPPVISLPLPAQAPPSATRAQTGVFSSTVQTSGTTLVATTVALSGQKSHTPQPHTLANSMSPEPSPQSTVCHEEDGDTGDHSAGPSQLSLPLSGSAPMSTGSTLSGTAQTCQRVAHKCPQCGKCFIYRSQVLRHLRTHKVRHKCSQCGQGFRTPAALNDHKRAQCAGATFDCLLCGKAMTSLRELYRHRLTHKTNTCFQCAAGFKTKAELIDHLHTHRVRPLHQCCLCGKRFRLLSSLTNHKQTHSAAGGFACTRCEQVFASGRERDAHRQMHRVPKLPCPVCGDTFTSQTKLIRHQQTHPAADGEEQRYKCRHCEETFTGLTQLRIHQRQHMEKPYRCDQCTKAFSTLGGLHNHKGTHSGERPYLCTDCGKSFRTKDGLEGHLRIHTGEKPFACPHCGKRFTALAGLNVHVRRHTGERPYVCEVCGKGWPSGGDLQKHMRSHTGEKPYSCLECGKTFSISCHLTEHRRSHSGEKPFTCPECGKSLKRKFDLKKHMLSHSDTRPFPCSHCDKSYTRRTHLNRHMQTHSLGLSTSNPDP